MVPLLSKSSDCRREISRGVIRDNTSDHNFRGGDPGREIREIRDGHHDSEL